MQIRTLVAALALLAATAPVAEAATDRWTVLADRAYGESVVDASQPIRIEIPGRIARHPAGHDGLGEAGRPALGKGREVRRGQGYSPHVTALPDIHHALLAAAAILGKD